MRRRPSVTCKDNTASVRSSYWDTLGAVPWKCCTQAWRGFISAVQPRVKAVGKNSQLVPEQASPMMFSKNVPILTQHPEIDIQETSANDPTGPRIRCPKCNWSPRAHDRWMCKCGHIWNTFDTGGVCPACLYQWTMTACLACHLWSPHSDWYTQD